MAVDLETFVRGLELIQNHAYLDYREPPDWVRGRVVCVMEEEAFVFSHDCGFVYVHEDSDLGRDRWPLNLHDQVRVEIRPNLGITGPRGTFQHRLNFRELVRFEAEMDPFMEYFAHWRSPDMHLLVVQMMKGFVPFRQFMLNLKPYFKEFLYMDEVDQLNLDIKELFQPRLPVQADVPRPSKATANAQPELMVKYTLWTKRAFPVGERPIKGKVSSKMVLESSNTLIVKGTFTSPIETNDLYRFVKALFASSESLRSLVTGLKMPELTSVFEGTVIALMATEGVIYCPQLGYVNFQKDKYYRNKVRQETISSGSKIEKVKFHAIPINGGKCKLSHAFCRGKERIKINLAHFMKFRAVRLWSSDDAMPRNALNQDLNQPTLSFFQIGILLRNFHTKLIPSNVAKTDLVKFFPWTKEKDDTLRNHKQATSVIEDLKPLEMKFVSKLPADFQDLQPIIEDQSLIDGVLDLEIL